MCNANNHHAGCNCGFGGENYGAASFTGYSSRSSSLSYQFLDWLRPINGQSHTSYTTPNASCPVCGVSVFFYQSPHGGRVFFDELGPPWSKHPCTDSNSTPEKPVKSNHSIDFKWVKDGWRPLIIDKIRRIDGSLSQIFYELTIKEKNNCFTLYFPSKKLPKWYFSDTKKVVGHYRKDIDDAFIISFFVENEEIALKAYAKRSLARNAIEGRRKLQPKKTIMAVALSKAGLST